MVMLSNSIMLSTISNTNIDNNYNDDILIIRQYIARMSWTKPGNGVKGEVLATLPYRYTW